MASTPFRAAPDFRFICLMGTEMRGCKDGCMGRLRETLLPGLFLDSTIIWFIAVEVDISPVSCRDIPAPRFAMAIELRDCSRPVGT